MTSYVAVFRSKTQLLTFMQAMRHEGVPIQTTQTPPKAGVGCGISASFDKRYYTVARQIINAYQLNSFHCFFQITKDGVRITYERIN